MHNQQKNEISKDFEQKLHKEIKRNDSARTVLELMFIPIIDFGKMMLELLGGNSKNSHSKPKGEDHGSV